MTEHKLKQGMRVRVLWGLDTVEGTILEVWGDPPQHVRIALELGGPDKPDDIVPLLLSPSVIEEALPA
jgi:hypothetical protein